MDSLRYRIARPQRRRIQSVLRKTKSRLEAVRARVLLLLAAGEDVACVAAVVGCARATVYRTWYRFEALGEDSVRDQRQCRQPSKVTPDVVAALLGYLRQSPRERGWQRATWTLELLALQLHSEHNVTLSPSHVRNVLVFLGVRRKRPRVALRIPVRGRRAVLKRIQHLVTNASGEEEVFYLDEADVDLNPRIGFAYMPKGKQTLVLTPGKNVKRYIAGALNARTGRVSHVVGARKNSALFIELLFALRRRYRRARRLHLVLDNYVIHRSRQTLECLARAAGRIVLHFLPPYSPEANVIERLWKQLHDQVTRNHTHKTIEALIEAVEEFLATCQPFPGSPSSLMARVSGTVQAI